MRASGRFRHRSVEVQTDRGRRTAKENNVLAVSNKICGGRQGKTSAVAGMAVHCPASRRRAEDSPGHGNPQHHRPSVTPHCRDAMPITSTPPWPPVRPTEMPTRRCATAARPGRGLPQPASHRLFHGGATDDPGDPDCPGPSQSAPPPAILLYGMGMGRLSIVPASSGATQPRTSFIATMRLAWTVNHPAIPVALSTFPRR